MYVYFLTGVKYKIFVSITSEARKTNTPLEVEPSDTIKTVKAKIHQKKEIPPECQELTFAGKDIDEHTLSYYNIMENARLRLSTIPWKGNQL